ncbi:MAG: GldM family protein [Bacteroidota bacterium]
MKKPFISLLFIAAVLMNAQLVAQTENAVVVAAYKMNVLYIGIDNPISIAVAGVSNDKLRVSIMNGTLVKNGDKYVVKVDNVNDVIINVAAEMKPGEIKMMGSTTFRVKRIPDPIPCLNGNCTPNASISKAELLKNAVVSVFMQLPFEMKFEIESFTLTYNTDNSIVSEWTSGNLFSQKMIDAVSKIEKGNKIYLENIKAKGPDGTSRMLSSTWFVLMD